MSEFIAELIACDDFEALLGDMYQPTCACIVISFAVLSFGALCSMFTAIISRIFTAK